MALVTRTVNTSHPSAVTALKALAGIVGISDSITFSTEAVTSGSFTVEMSVTAKNSFSGTETTYSVSGFAACARAICKAVPECGLWGQIDGGAGQEASVESWVETASALITPAYVAADDKGT